MARRRQIEVQGFIVYARRSSGTNLLLFAIQNEVQETNGWFRVQGLNVYRFENKSQRAPPWPEVPVIAEAREPPPCFPMLNKTDHPQNVFSATVSRFSGFYRIPMEKG